MDVVEQAIHAVLKLLEHGASYDQYAWLGEVIDELEVIQLELEDTLIREGEL